MEQKKYLLTEIWKAKASWHALGQTERQNFLGENIGPLLMDMIAQGAEIVGIATNENTSPERMDYEFKAVWKLPNKALSDKLEVAVKDAGFYNYFEQVNFSGDSISPQDLIEKMIQI